MKKKYVIVVCMLLCSLVSAKDDMKLQALLENQINGFKGVAGVYVRNLKTGQMATINADTLFPTASMIKVPILLKIFDRINQDSLNYSEDLTWYADTVHYDADDGILCAFQEGKTISLGKVISLMITYSDNHASLWLQQLAGGGIAINQWLDDHGFKDTRVNSRTEGRLQIREVYGWGHTTPREMAGLLTMVYERKAVSPAASEEILRVLGTIYWDGEAISQIPPEIKTHSKQGAVDRSRSEVVLVNAPSGPYVFCLITKNQEDTSWEHTNEGYVLLRNVSALLWNYFEPKHPFTSNQDSTFFK